MYNIIDRKTKQIVGTVSSLRKASSRIIKLDNEYGACRYFYKKAGV